MLLKVQAEDCTTLTDNRARGALCGLGLTCFWRLVRLPLLHLVGCRGRRHGVGKSSCNLDSEAELETTGQARHCGLHLLGLRFPCTHRMCNMEGGVADVRKPGFEPVYQDEA